MTTRFLQLLTPAGIIQVPIESGEVVLVAGPNGVGKSALMAALYRSLGENGATYLPGYRQVNLNNGVDTVGIDSATLRMQLYQHVDNFNRYKSSWSEDQFKMILKTLLHAESAYLRELRDRVVAAEDGATEIASRRDSPLDTVNQIFSNARLAVSFEVTDEGLTSRRGHSSYSVDALSDGERAAVYIASAMVIQNTGSVILIDEPEKHLHPSITGLLIEACIRARPDIGVVLASHDVHLIENLNVQHIIHIRDSDIIHTKPESRAFHADIIRDVGGLPEALKRDLLGTRSDILFVEGQHTSYDLAMYSLVYENVKVSPRGGYAKVVEAVKALRGLDNAHWLKPYGLIDGDGREAEEVERLAGEKIYCLPCPTVENLFFSEEAISCFVDADLAHHDGPSLADRLAALEKYILSSSSTAIPDIVARRTNWLIERSLSASKLSTKFIRENELDDIVVEAGKIKQSVLMNVEDTIATNDYSVILRSLPIKNTSLPGGAVKTLGAVSFDAYCQAILRQIETRSRYGNAFITFLRGQLPVLKD